MKWYPLLLAPCLLQLASGAIVTLTSESTFNVTQNGLGVTPGLPTFGITFSYDDTIQNSFQTVAVQNVEWDDDGTGLNLTTVDFNFGDPQFRPIDQSFKFAAFPTSAAPLPDVFEVFSGFDTAPRFGFIRYNDNLTNFQSAPLVNMEFVPVPEVSSSAMVGLAAIFTLGLRRRCFRQE